MSTSLFVCIFILIFIAFVGIFAFIGSLSPRRASLVALAYLSEAIRKQGLDNAYKERAAFNNLTQASLYSATDVKEALGAKAYLLKSAKEQPLTSRQQLLLLDGLLGTHTNAKQILKITRVRTVKEIVTLALSKINDKDVCIAPMALFH